MYCFVIGPSTIEKPHSLTLHVITLESFPILIPGDVNVDIPVKLSFQCKLDML